MRERFLLGVLVFAAAMFVIVGDCRVLIPGNAIDTVRADKPDSLIRPRRISDEIPQMIRSVDAGN